MKTQYCDLLADGTFTAWRHVKHSGTRPSFDTRARVTHILARNPETGELVCELPPHPADQHRPSHYTGPRGPRSQYQWRMDARKAYDEHR